MSVILQVWSTDTRLLQSLKEFHRIKFMPWKHRCYEFGMDFTLILQLHLWPGLMEVYLKGLLMASYLKGWSRGQKVYSLPRLETEFNISLGTIELYLKIKKEKVVRNIAYTENSWLECVRWFNFQDKKKRGLGDKAANTIAHILVEAPSRVLGRSFSSFNSPQYHTSYSFFKHSLIFQRPEIPNLSLKVCIVLPVPTLLKSPMESLSCD